MSQTIISTWRVRRSNCLISVPESLLRRVKRSSSYLAAVRHPRIVLSNSCGKIS